jgi:hypothetical protein
LFFVLAVCQYHLGLVRCGHQVCVTGPRCQPPVQVFNLPQLPLQSEVAVQNLCGTCPSIQGSNTRVPSVSFDCGRQYMEHQFTSLPFASLICNYFQFVLNRHNVLGITTQLDKQVLQKLIETALVSRYNM